MSEESLEYLNDEALNRLAAELRRLPGIGYYGPTKPKGMHLDNQRCNTKEEALALYEKHWTDTRQGFVNGKNMIEDEIHLCYWKDDWGPLIVHQPADYLEATMELEEWFLNYYHEFQVTVQKSHGVLSAWVDRIDDSGAWGTSSGPYCEESRLRTIALLEVLKQLREAED